MYNFNINKIGNIMSLGIPHCLESEGELPVVRPSDGVSALDAVVELSIWMVQSWCFGTVFRNGWWCFGMDGSVSVFRAVFRNSVSKWMVVFRCFGTVFRNGWFSLGMDGSVGGVSGKSVSEMAKSGWSSGWSSERCFGTVFRNLDGSVSEWMVQSKHPPNIH